MQILIAIALSDITATSFSTCFSSLSYLHGDLQTSTLTLVLMPFENLDLITKQNLCREFLPGKNVLVHLYFRDRVFPAEGEQVFFQYEYNQQQTVDFKLTPAEYQEIYNEPNAMFELGYDVKLVLVNCLINRIEHTTTNATNCFRDA